MEGGFFDADGIGLFDDQGVHVTLSLLLVDGECVLRFDNETGKGDHRHFGDKEVPLGLLHA